MNSSGVYTSDRQSHSKDTSSGGVVLSPSKDTSGRIRIANIQLDAIPGCAWKEIISSLADPRGNLTKNNFFILKSFVSAGIRVDCPLTVDTVNIRCMGILKVQVKFSRHRDHLLADPNNQTKIKVQDISIVQPSDDSAIHVQQINFKIPWPCEDIEISIVEKYSHFVCIFCADGFCDDVRSSEQSTPIGRGPVNFPSKFSLS